MSQSQSLQITFRPVSRPLDAGPRRPGAALLVVCALVSIATMLRAEGLRLAVFDMDATPPVGSMMAYDPVKGQGELGLRGRGVILLGAGEPIVLCAVDWIGISNEGHDVFRQMLAEAAGTTPQRVAVHTVHQHDAPECDFGTERLLRERGLPLGRYEGSFARAVLERLTAGVRVSLSESKPVTHLPQSVLPQSIANPQPRPWLLLFIGPKPRAWGWLPETRRSSRAASGVQEVIRSGPLTRTSSPGEALYVMRLPASAPPRAGLTHSRYVPA